MKRGTKVKIYFTGQLARKPIETNNGESFIRVKVDGKPGWIAIVPTDTATVYEDENDYANGHTYDRDLR